MHVIMTSIRIILQYHGNGELKYMHGRYVFSDKTFLTV